MNNCKAYKKELISIVVPIYNSEKSLNKCIDSILSQDYKDFELILVNDGSNDNSYDICIDYSKRDKRIKIINSKNEGVSSARNKGITKALGKYLIFIDSDDYINENMIGSLYRSSESNQDNFIICGFNKYDNCGKNKGSVVFENNNKYTLLPKDDFYQLYSKWLLNLPWNKMYNTKLILDNNIRFKTNYTLGEDLLFNLEYLTCVKGNIYILNKELYNYTIDDEKSLSNKYYENFFEIQKELHKKIFKCINLISNNFELYREDFYTDYLFNIIWSLENTFKKSNKIKFIEKIKCNRKILCSKEMRICLKEFNRNSIGKINLIILTSRSALLQYLYQNIRKILK